MFTYCGNNPVCRADTSGQFWGVVIGAAVALGGLLLLSSCAPKSSKKPAPYSGQANCYAYAMKLENDPRTNQLFTSKPQPGTFSGTPLSSRDLKKGKKTVKETIKKKVSSDAKVLKYNFREVDSASYIPEEGNWLVALAYASDGSDYHWWRKNEDGTWSHKPGSTPILHWDASGNVITDPGICNRGIYDEFLGYYEVGPN